MFRRGDAAPVGDGEGQCWNLHAGISCGKGSIALASVIARSEATKQSILSLRRNGLLRFARNDDGGCFVAQCARGWADPFLLLPPASSRKYSQICAPRSFW